MNLAGGVYGWVLGGILAVLGGIALARLLIGWVVAPLAGTSPDERAEDCGVCGHPAGAHEHDRLGSDCGLCTTCGSFRRPPLLARRRARGMAAPDDECKWCRKPRYSDIAYGPRDCTCDGPCDVVWCNHRPVTA